jgi:hypothetical protein
MVLKQTLKKSIGTRVHWLDLARETDKWQAIVNVAENLEVQ